MYRYYRVCKTVFQEGRQGEAAVKVIGTTICAARKLKWREVQALFFVHPEHDSSDYDGDRPRIECKALCGSLIDLQCRESEPENEAFLTIVHQTAQQYVKSSSFQTTWTDLIGIFKVYRELWMGKLAITPPDHDISLPQLSCFYAVRAINID